MRVLTKCIECRLRRLEMLLRSMLALVILVAVAVVVLAARPSPDGKTTATLRKIDAPTTPTMLAEE